MNISRFGATPAVVLGAITFALGAASATQAESLDIGSASIADLNTAYGSGRLTSEKVTSVSGGTTTK